MTSPNGNAPEIVAQVLIIQTADGQVGVQLNGGAELSKITALGMLEIAKAAIIGMPNALPDGGHPAEALPKIIPFANIPSDGGF